mmetsp:Transcript_13020/g.37707  ORF Transcript_13020/g.37707 Transcript_13020/m.37707 type:complete len:211 (+) Transcript_13020:498-1130(+)
MIQPMIEPKVLLHLRHSDQRLGPNRFRFVLVQLLLAIFGALIQCIEIKIVSCIANVPHHFVIQIVTEIQLHWIPSWADIPSEHKIERIRWNEGKICGISSADLAQMILVASVFEQKVQQLVASVRIPWDVLVAVHGDVGDVAFLLQQLESVEQAQPDSASRFVNDIARLQVRDEELLLEFAHVLLEFGVGLGMSIETLVTESLFEERQVL